MVEKNDSEGVGGKAVDWVKKNQKIAYTIGGIIIVLFLLVKSGILPI